MAIFATFAFPDTARRSSQRVTGDASLCEVGSCRLLTRFSSIYSYMHNQLDLRQDDFFARRRAKKRATESIEVDRFAPDSQNLNRDLEKM